MMHLKSYMKLEAFLLKEKKMASHILHTCPLDEQYTHMPQFIDRIFTLRPAKPLAEGRIKGY